MKEEPYYLKELCPDCGKFHLVKNGEDVYCPAWWCRLQTEKNNE